MIMVHKLRAHVVVNLFGRPVPRAQLIGRDGGGGNGSGSRRRRPASERLSRPFLEPAQWSQARLALKPPPSERQLASPSSDIQPGGVSVARANCTRRGLMRLGWGRLQRARARSRGLFPKMQAKIHKSSLSRLVCKPTRRERKH